MTKSIGHIHSIKFINDGSKCIIEMPGNQPIVSDFLELAHDSMGRVVHVVLNSKIIKEDSDSCTVGNVDGVSAHANLNGPIVTEIKLSYN